MDFAACLSNPPWQAASYGVGPRHWWVCRPGTHHALKDRRGQIRWFGSYETADEAAKQANTEAGYQQVQQPDGRMVWQYTEGEQ